MQINTPAQDCFRVVNGSDELGPLLAGAEASVAPSVNAAPAGIVQIMNADERRLEIRYYDTPGKSYSRWHLPIEDAKDLVRWWVGQGCTQTPQGGSAPQQCVGRIWASIPSDTVVYLRCSDVRGRPNVTGFHFPRAVVEALASTQIIQDKKDSGS